MADTPTPDWSTGYTGIAASSHGTEPAQPNPHPSSYRVRELASDLDRYHELQSPDMERAVGVELMAVGSMIRDERPTPGERGLNTPYDSLRSMDGAKREVTDHISRDALTRVKRRMWMLCSVTYICGMLLGYLTHSALSMGVSVVSLTVLYFVYFGRRP